MNIEANLNRQFMLHQINWIQAEEPLHAAGKQAIILAEKSVRIGWTYADAFKNVRKRLWFKNRDYLFATKDYASALEYIRQCYAFAEIFNYTRAITCHGEEFLRLNRADDQGRPSAFTEDVKVGVIKFDNGSRIIAFSASPQAMAVYGGDVGLDEFAKHPNARLLWETAQGRITWGYDLAIWSSHDGEDTLFNEFAQEARAICGTPTLGHPALRPEPASNGQSHNPGSPSPSSDPAESKLENQNSEIIPRPQSQTENQNSKMDPLPASEFESQNSEITPCPQSKIENQNSKIPSVPWNAYFRVTMPDAIQLGLVDVINRTRGTTFTPKQFLDDCHARAREEEIFEQTYLCNPLGVAANHIVEWSAIERCRCDYSIERVHLEAAQVIQRFGDFVPYDQDNREAAIRAFIREKFPALFKERTNVRVYSSGYREKPKFRLGFDVAASGRGDLAVFYIDEATGPDLWLQALLTVRTEDWHFLKTCLFYFLDFLSGVEGAGDETGLGRQICWEAAKKFRSSFTPVNFTAKKHDLGFSLMNQLTVAQKRFPRSEPDIAADYFALRKSFQSNRWTFSEGRNTANPVSHCDIAWAGALASHVHAARSARVGGAVAMETGWTDGKNFYPYKPKDFPT